MPERERLAFQSDIIQKVFGGNLYFAPLEEKPPRRILDIATGTGEWAILMGDKFPQSHIIATDLSPIQPGEVPPNVNFYVEDSCVVPLPIHLHLPLPSHDLGAVCCLERQTRLADKKGAGRGK